MKYGIALALALILNATANLMMKFGVRRFNASGITLEQGPWAVTWGFLTNWVLVVGLICFASNVLFYTYALSGIKISIAYPIMVSGGFVIIAIAAWLYLSETLATGQWVGIIFILLGVYLIARQMQPQTGT